MSFILDALKKSEAERQNQAGASISTTPRAAARSQLPAWAVALLGALSVAVVALGLAWWQAQRSPPPQAPPSSMGAENGPVAAPAGGPVRNLAAVARRSNAPGDTPLTGDPAATDTRNPSPSPQPSVERQPSVATASSLPTNADLAAQGITLPDMNLDIHVFSGNQAERFVFINSTKYREGDRLRDGPRVEEITAAGVILNHQGISFLLPRD